MPSYTLKSLNNLGDVFDITQAKFNLFEGNVLGLKTMFSNNVSINDGSIHVNRLQLKIEGDTIPGVSIIESEDQEGTMVWSTSRYDNHWIYDTTVFLSGFEHDITYIQNIQLQPVAFSGDYNDLSSNTLPQTDDFIADTDRSNLIQQESNLHDLQNHNLAFSNLELSDLAYEPMEDGYVFVNGITFRELKVFHYENEVGNVLTNVRNTKSIRNREYHNIADWTNVFQDQNGQTLDIFTLSPFFIEQSFTRTVQCAALSNMYVDIRNLLGNAQLNVFPDNIEIDIQNLIDRDHFLYTISNLGDIDLDSTKSKENIGLGNLADLNSNTPQTYTRLEVTESIIYPDLITLSNIDYLIVASNVGSNLGTIDHLDIRHASSDQFGYVRIGEIGESNDYVFSWDTLNNNDNQLRDRISQLENNIKYDYDEYTNNSNVLFLDNELTFYSNGTKIPEVNFAKNNLHLTEVSSSGRFDDLVTKPANIEAFTNNIGALKRSDNCSSILNIREAQHNLGLGDLSRQDRHDIHLNGTELFLDNLQAHEIYLFDSSSNNPINYEGKWISSRNGQGTCKYIDLPVASATQFGIVKLASDHLDVSPDKVMQISKLRNLNQLLNNRIDEMIKLYNTHVRDL